MTILWGIDLDLSVAAMYSSLRKVKRTLRLFLLGRHYMISDNFFIFIQISVALKLMPISM